MPGNDPPHEACLLASDFVGADMARKFLQIAAVVHICFWHDLLYGQKPGLPVVRLFLKKQSIDSQLISFFKELLIFAIVNII